MPTITHQDFEVKEVMYAPDEQGWPECGVPCQRRMRVTRSRQLQEIHLEHPLFLVVTLGVYACANPRCQGNGRLCPQRVRFGRGRSTA